MFSIKNSICIYYLLITDTCLAQSYLFRRRIRVDYHKSHHHHHHCQIIPFWAIAFLRRFCQICHPVFTSMNFATIFFFLQSMVVILASNPQPGGPGLCSYVPKWQGGPVIPPGTGFPFRRLLRLAGLQWGYSNQPPHGTSPNSDN
jgi:hypothetical protein